MHSQEQKKPCLEYVFFNSLCFKGKKHAFDIHIGVTRHHQQKISGSFLMGTFVVDSTFSINFGFDEQGNMGSFFVPIVVSVCGLEDSK